MGSSLSKVFAILIAVLLMFIFPIMDMFERQDDTSRLLVLTESSKFVDSVRNLGYISPAMYREFRNKISSTGNIYNIELEHYHSRVDPIYDDPKDLSTFKDDFNVNFKAYYTDDILSVLFPGGGTSGSKYTFSKGDYFAVRIKNINKTKATRIQEIIYNTPLANEKIIISYGGMIKDENY